MTMRMTFNEAKEKNFKILEQYVPIVDRVHGAYCHTSIPGLKSKSSKY
jgi:hypothetical protein